MRPTLPSCNARALAQSSATLLQLPRIIASRRLSSSARCGSPSTSLHLATARNSPSAGLSRTRTLTSSALVCSQTSADGAKWKLARVPNRGAVEVSGRDTVKLLQGLVSNDVKALASATEPHAPALVYAGFMNPQGRMLADVFIHRQAPLQDGSPRWLLDIDSRTLPSLLAFIKKFKLRSKVKLADVSDEYSVVQAWSSAASPPSSTLTEQLSLDPRCPAIGYRGVVSHEAVTKLREQIASVEDEEYTIHRMLRGVAEGALDVPEAASLPLENNLDYMHGVDFRKGCYVGQELTARTQHTGVVRKRIVPLQFYLPGTPAPDTLHIDRAATFQLPSHLAEVRSKPVSTASATAKPARGKAAGKFTSGIYNLGLACLRLEQVQRWTDASNPTSEDGLEMSVLSADGETTLLVKPHIPKWWPEPPQPADNDPQE
ncbi:hypothetical protein PaG_00468 [Moesziomyces aphidis]|uniref:CAF17 C-terminal domain-containing protein n=1 Tax=Moesziomyces aphidis TaxID=84754 RepID=W3VVZ9_MOEAP|nr:hypothetical protein PaG_00468 [Moesziomyces aphidis]